MSLTSLFFKGSRFVFFIICLEFMLLSILFYFSYLETSFLFIFFLCLGLMGSVLGLALVVVLMKETGSDLSFFYFWFFIFYLFFVLIVLCKVLFFNFFFYIFFIKF